MVGNGITSSIISDVHENPSALLETSKVRCLTITGTIRQGFRTDNALEDAGEFPSSFGLPLLSAGKTDHSHEDYCDCVMLISDLCCKNEWGRSIDASR